MGNKLFFALGGLSQHAPNAESLIISLMCRPLCFHEFVSTAWACMDLDAPCLPAPVSTCYQFNRVVLSTDYQDDCGSCEVSCLVNRRVNLLDL